MKTAHQPSLSTYGNEIVDVRSYVRLKDVFREKTSGVAFELQDWGINCLYMWLISVEERSLARSLDVCVAHVIIWMRFHNR